MSRAALDTTKVTPWQIRVRHGPFALLSRVKDRTIEGATVVRKSVNSGSHRSLARRPSTLR